jgi:type 1 fimbriae regulatory protein FimE
MVTKFEHCASCDGRGRPANALSLLTERGGSPITPHGFRVMLARIGVRAKLELHVHPHMLRHATGFHLANKGKDTRLLAGYMGHQNLQHTRRYAELAPNRFKGFWED